MAKKLTCIVVLENGEVIKETLKVTRRHAHLRDSIYKITESALKFAERPKGERGAFTFGSMTVDLNYVVSLQFKEK